MSKIPVSYCIEYMEAIIKNDTVNLSGYNKDDVGDQYLLKNLEFKIEVDTTILEHLKGIKE